ncbi:hypothetical protein [Stutzerimonas nitrititolerans]|uniref:hypothetical protein n=1 Tax=Stutzerimonas nitrititolerans TaxID=2482751 RepID=UPI0028A89EF8|nr:hypothetical protein [Stutzerimonas nitrititolerans]
MIEQGKIYTNVMINELHVSRNGDAFDISFSFVSDGNKESALLLGVRDPSNLHEILSAERLWVENALEELVTWSESTL